MQINTDIKIMLEIVPGVLKKELWTTMVEIKFLIYSTSLVKGIAKPCSQLHSDPLPST